MAGPVSGTPGQRLRLIGNSLGFLLLPEAQDCPHGAQVLDPKLQHLSADWQAEWLHTLELGESFVDPSQFKGTVHQAAHWPELVLSHGYARSNGQYTDPEWPPKTLRVDSLHPDARKCRAGRVPGIRKYWPKLCRKRT